MARKHRDAVETERKVQHFLEVVIEYEQQYSPALWRVRTPSGSIIILNSEDYQSITSKEVRSA